MVKNLFVKGADKMCIESIRAHAISGGHVECRMLHQVNRINKTP